MTYVEGYCTRESHEYYATLELAHEEIVSNKQWQGKELEVAE